MIKKYLTFLHTVRVYSYIFATGESTARDANSDDERESNLKSDTELDEEVDNYFETKLRESCLKQLYPAIYDEECERYRILERVAGLFIYFLGIRGSLRIGPTGFRTFARLIVNSLLY